MPTITLSSPLSEASRAASSALLMSSTSRGVGGQERVSLRSRASLSPLALGDGGTPEYGNLEVDACSREAVRAGRARFLVRDGTASDSCFAFLSLREAENEGLTGEAKDRDEGDERAEADEGSRRGGGLMPFLRGDVLVDGAFKVGRLPGEMAILESPAVASDRAGRRGRSLASSRVAAEGGCRFVCGWI